MTIKPEMYLDFGDLDNSLILLGDVIYDINVEKGWRGPDETRTFGDEVALIHSEVSEMLEAYRDFGNDQGLYRHPNGEFAAELQNEDGTLNKPISMEAEAADILIRLVDTCRHMDINLAEATLTKLTYNASRPHRHGGKNL